MDVITVPGLGVDLSQLSSQQWFTILVVLVALERLAELIVATRNARWSFARGGYEVGREHYPVMVLLHTGLLVGVLWETQALERPFIPLLGWPMLVLAIGAQVLRWTCIITLRHQWNTRVIVVPGLTLVQRGPYRWMRHPNYVAVVIEGIALPLVHSNWIVAVAFTFANYFILRRRLAVENEALSSLQPMQRVR
jgi:methyltransferase